MELEAPAYRARIERLQLLLQQVDTVMQNVYQQEQQFDTSFFEQLAENAYYRTIYNTQCRTGLGFSFSHVDQKQIDRALRMNWSGKHYSNRIWIKTFILDCNNRMKGVILCQRSGRYFILFWSVAYLWFWRLCREYLRCRKMYSGSSRCIVFWKDRPWKICRDRIRRHMKSRKVCMGRAEITA